MDTAQSLMGLTCADMENIIAVEYLKFLILVAGWRISECLQKLGLLIA